MKQAYVLISLYKTEALELLKTFKGVVECYKLIGAYDCLVKIKALKPYDVWRDIRKLDGVRSTLCLTIIGENEMGLTIGENEDGT